MRSQPLACLQCRSQMMMLRRRFASRRSVVQYALCSISGFTATADASAGGAGADEMQCCWPRLELRGANRCAPGPAAAAVHSVACGLRLTLCQTATTSGVSVGFRRACAETPCAQSLASLVGTAGTASTSALRALAYITSDRCACACRGLACFIRRARWLLSRCRPRRDTAGPHHCSARTAPVRCAPRRPALRCARSRRPGKRLHQRRRGAGAARRGRGARPRRAPRL